MGGDYMTNELMRHLSRVKSTPASQLSEEDYSNEVRPSTGTVKERWKQEGSPADRKRIYEMFPRSSPKHIDKCINNFNSIP